MSLDTYGVPARHRHQEALVPEDTESYAQHAGLKKALT